MQRDLLTLDRDANPRRCARDLPERCRSRLRDYIVAPDRSLRHVIRGGKPHKAIMPQNGARHGEKTQAVRTKEGAAVGGAIEAG